MQGKLAKATELTGGVKLIWSTRLRTAAGRAYWTRQKGMKDQHNLQIELSTRIITDEGISQDNECDLNFGDWCVWAWVCGMAWEDF